MYSIIRFFLFRFTPDFAHSFIEKVFSLISVLPYASTIFWRLRRNMASSPTKLGMITFAHPVCLAAGFDKNATMLPLLQFFGFAAIEVGSVSACRSNGNPYPRMLRLSKSRSIINRCGLNNDGVDQVMNRLIKVRPQLGIPIGVNIAKTHDPSISGSAGIEDVILCFHRAKSVADYITLNLSCPNTQEGKTLENIEALSQLLPRMRLMNEEIPVLVKLSSDLSFEELYLLMNYSLSQGVRGFVLSNTSNIRSKLSSDELEKATAFGRGGLSGPHLKERTIGCIAWARAVLPSDTFLVASGGLEGHDDFKQAIDAGANLVQIYTSFIYRGKI